MKIQKPNFWGIAKKTFNILDNVFPSNRPTLNLNTENTFVKDGIDFEFKR